MTRARPVASTPVIEWAHRRGASPEANNCFMVQTPRVGRAGYKVAARGLALDGGFPSVRFRSAHNARVSIGRQTGINHESTEKYQHA